jgi:hypothetical protein
MAARVMVAAASHEMFDSEIATGTALLTLSAQVSRVLFFDEYPATPSFFPSQIGLSIITADDGRAAWIGSRQLAQNGSTIIG